jgi:hypothetical protein
VAKRVAVIVIEAEASPRIDYSEASHQVLEVDAAVAGGRAI